MANFEGVMMKRLANCHADACAEIFASMKAGRSLGEAVLDAIEVLPMSKTRDLRRWVKDWEAWDEWQKWRAKGWSIRKNGPSVVARSPGAEMVGARTPVPSIEAVAAAASVPGVMRTSRDYDYDKGQVILRHITTKDA